MRIAAPRRGDPHPDQATVGGVDVTIHYDEIIVSFEDSEGAHAQFYEGDNTEKTDQCCDFLEAVLAGHVTVEGGTWTWSGPEGPRAVSRTILLDAEGNPLGSAARSSPRQDEGDPWQGVSQRRAAVFLAVGVTVAVVGVSRAWHGAWWWWVIVAVALLYAYAWAGYIVVMRRHR